MFEHFEQCLEAVGKYGGFGIAAHIDQAAGFETLISKYDTFKESLFCNSHLLALEISKAQNELWFTDRDENRNRKLLIKTRRQRLKEEDTYEIAKVMGSDSHALDRLGLNAAGDPKLTRYRDVLLKKDGNRTVVYKRYGVDKCVGSPEIQQFVGNMQIYGVPQGFCVATTRFCPPAIKLAAGRGIELIDDAKLALLVRKVFPQE